VLLVVTLQLGRNKTFICVVVTFRVSCRRHEMCIGHVRLCVCLFLPAFQHYCMDLDVTWGNGKGCPIVVHYWADLQLVHGFCCYDNMQVCKLIALYTANAYSAEGEISAITVCLVVVIIYVYELYAVSH